MSEVLQVNSVDFHVVKNAKEHYTDLYELIHNENATPIFRRGQKFTITIHFANHNIVNDDSAIRLIFNFENELNESEGTSVILPLRNVNEDLENCLSWAHNIIDQNSEENFIILEIISPPECPVGKWTFKIDTGDDTVDEYHSDIYILFNPWCTGDLVYMEDKQKLDEYILSDIGKIWLGLRESCTAREWIFGQYDACVLPAIMLMFNQSNLSDICRGDPVKTTRTISKLVKSDDGKGILMARWDGKYFDGIPPAAWTGSADILNRFLDTKKPVEYGHCWVFAGVVTTICRALGIPSRVVSNLVSPQDANDKYNNENDEEIHNNSVSEETKWHYHVWNDVWMARPDLLPGFDGWQAINATPTKNSHGLQECGPASLEAIKQGIVDLNYDVGFMLASVNADVIRWKKDPLYDMGTSKMYCKKNKIGGLILTKSLCIYDTNGSYDKENITHEYKAPGGSQLYYDEPDSTMDDTEISLVELNQIQLGEPFDITVKIENYSNITRNFDCILCAKSFFYNGIKANEIKNLKDDLIVLPQSNNSITLTVQPEEYLDKLVEYGIVNVHATVTDNETNAIWVDGCDFQVQNPIINIDVPDELDINEDATAVLTFTNPLQKSLTNCRFYVAGPGLLRSISIEIEDIEPEAECKAEVIITPSADGNRKVIATFTSDELVDITGSIEISI